MSKHDPHVRAKPPEIQEQVDKLDNALYGQRVTLFVDGNPVTYSRLSAKSYNKEFGREEILIQLHTTREAINNPEHDAAVDFAKRGFEIGLAAQVVFKGSRPSGVVYLEGFQYDRSHRAAHKFVVRALTPIYDYRKQENDNVRLHANTRELFEISPDELAAMPENAPQ